MTIERPEFPGERPMTWVAVHDRLWRRLSDRWLRDQQERIKSGKLKGEARLPPATFFSKHVERSTGPGWMFPTPWVEGMELQDRADGVRYPHAGEAVWTPPTPESIARVDAMVAHLKVKLGSNVEAEREAAKARARAAIDDTNTKMGKPDIGVDETFAQMCERLGLDPKSVPNQPDGDWQQLGWNE